MRRVITALLLPAALLLIGAAHAETSTPLRLAKSAKAFLITPPEWDGTWTTVDSLYLCDGTFINVSPGEDTICGGKDYEPSSGSDLSCTGTADATTIDVTCTGSEPSVDFPGCTANYTIVNHQTRSGGTYFSVTTIEVSYSGPAGCDQNPPACLQVNSHGTRTGAAPLAYCATPTRKSTWGQIKTFYR